MNNSVLLTFFILGAGWLTVSEALKCEVCSGKEGNDCADPFSGSYAKDCFKGICQKLKYADKEGNMVVARACMPLAGLAGDKAGCTEKEENGVKGTYCYCKDKDSCNSSSISLYSTVAISVGVLLSYIIKC